MDMSYTPEQLAFREEVVEWIASAMPPEMKRKADGGAAFSSKPMPLARTALTPRWEPCSRATRATSSMSSPVSGSRITRRNSMPSSGLALVCTNSPDAETSTTKPV